MNELQNINLRDLQRFWYTGQAPERAVQHVREALAAGALQTLLRDHAERSVNDLIEIRKRDDFDDLLSFCGLVELASLSGFGPSCPSGGIIDELAVLLRLEAASRFYQQYYPVLLPQLFLQRVDGRRQVVEKDSDAASSLFLRFISLTEPIVNDRDVRRFTRLLDDFTLRGGYRREDLFATLDDLGVFMDHITRDSKDADSLSSACRGFLVFARFGVDFIRLLEDSASCPRLRAGMWEFHSYWFKELKAHVLDASQRYAEAAKRLGREHRLSKADLEAMDDMLRQPLEALKRLCASDLGEV